MADVSINLTAKRLLRECIFKENMSVGKPTQTRSRIGKWKIIGKISHLSEENPIRRLLATTERDVCSFTWRHRAGRKFTMMDSVNPSSLPADGFLNLQQNLKQMSSSLNPQSTLDRQTISRFISTITVVVVFHRFPT